MKYYTAGNSCCNETTGTAVDISIDGTFASPNNTQVPSTQAVKTYADTRANATHTGEVTGSTVLTLDKTAITNKSTVTAATGDLVLIADVSDSNNLKGVTTESIASTIISTDATFASPLNTTVPSTLAAKTYIDLKAPTIFKKIAANYASTSSAANIPITDLSIPVIAGKSYLINASLIAQSDSLVSGFTITILNISSAVGNMAFTVSFGGFGSDGASGESQGLIRAFSGLAIMGQVNTANANTLIRINGVFVCTTSGTIVPAYRPEINGSLATIYAGSILTALEL